MFLCYYISLDCDFKLNRMLYAGFDFRTRGLGADFTWPFESSIYRIGKARFVVRCFCQSDLVYSSSGRGKTKKGVGRRQTVSVSVKTYSKWFLYCFFLRYAFFAFQQISNESEDEKQEKIHHIQTLLAYDLFHRKQFHESMKEFLKLGTDAYDVIRLFPDLLPQQQQGTDYPEPVRDLTEKELETSRLALIDYLTEMRHRLQSSDTQVSTLYSLS